MLRVGVLGIQGGFEEHMQMVKRVGCEAIDVRKKEQLVGLDGLVLPGGESTAIGLIATDNGLIEPIRDFIHKDRKPVFGTCAGMIVLSNEVTDQRKGGQALFGGLDTVVNRNGFGRQINSFEHKVNVPEGIPIHPKGEEVFIRAPIVEKTAANVKVLATLTHSFRDYCNPNATAHRSAENKEVVVGVQQENILAVSFHPELTEDTTWHEYFKTMIMRSKEGGSS
eukprot:TRINITY_DN42928_c0_g1_i1.p2 TRINITY_DN42928_c0_g1~~TRINITY_DN42928_c0_g1_i1.p2  ORF type:complete len:224 (+),score=62.14 TRINITY_DN42928_c0_g1_i1:59-730(+)